MPVVKNAKHPKSNPDFKRRVVYINISNHITEFPMVYFYGKPETKAKWKCMLVGESIDSCVAILYQDASDADKKPDFGKNGQAVVGTF